jgi:hypothetical protein
MYIVWALTLKKFCVLPVERIYVFCINHKTRKDFALCRISWLVLVTEMESVNCPVRTESSKEALVVFKGHFRSLYKIAKSDYYVSSFLSVRPSVCLHGTTLLPLEEFWWNLIFGFFRKSVQKNSSFIKKRTTMTGTLHEDVFTFMAISRWILLGMRNVLDKRYRKTRNTFPAQ